MKIRYFTICSANYLAYAKTLFSSLLKVDPAAGNSFTLFLVDDALPADEQSLLDFEVVLAKDLGVPQFWDMAFRYSVMEFNTAVKPFCINYLFDREDADAAIYLDPDIFFLSPPTEVTRALLEGADIVLTPHLLNPVEDDKVPDDKTIMQSGIYNLGFGAFRNSPDSRAFVDWWARRLLVDCRVDLENGIFVDQKFVDFAPAFVSNCKIIRHPGYNVAYWNLKNRPVTKSANGYFAGGEPISFFHFSGVIPGDREIFSKHQNRFEPKDIGDAYDLFISYLEQIDANGHNRLKDLPYSYGIFLDGQKIPHIFRSIYARITPSTQNSRKSLFSSDAAWVNAPAITLNGRKGLPATLLLEEIWHQRTDLHASFSISSDAGYEQLCRWFVSSAPTEYNLPTACISPFKDAIAALEGNAGQQKHASLYRQPKQWLAKRALKAIPLFRGVYRLLPNGFRVFLRDKLIRAASSTGTTTENTIKSRGQLVPPIKTGIGLYGYFNAMSGVGTGARLQADVLKNNEIPHSTHIIASGDGQNQIEIHGTNNHVGPSPYGVLLFHVNADQTKVVVNERTTAELASKYRIGYWAWELENFPDQWMGAFDYLDEIWACSEFTANSLRAKTDKPVHVVAHPVHRIQTPPVRRAQFGLPEDRTLLLTSLDLNSFPQRKNPYGAYAAFDTAFPDRNDDDPILIIKVHGQLNRDSEWTSFINMVNSDPRVLVLDLPMSNERYRQLQMCCDGFVSLHRSEGFGLNIIECMALGKPVIATNYGGNTDFMTSENSYPIEFDLIPVSHNQYVDWNNQVWADPSIEHAAKALRSLISDPEDAFRRAKAAQSDVLDNFSEKRIGQLIRNHLKRISLSIKE